MNESNDLTPQERITVEIGNDPRRVFRITVTRMLSYLVPSACLVIYAIVSKQYGYGLIGYGILLVEQAQRLILVWKGLKIKQRVLQKQRAAQ